MCGVIGLCMGNSQQSAIPETIEALLALQHRGQDACGVVAHDGCQPLTSHKGYGLVSEVFDSGNNGAVEVLKGHSTIAHVRYPTNGSHAECQIQPITRKGFTDVAISHNGNIVNASDLSDHLSKSGLLTRSKVTGDSQLILEIFLSRLKWGPNHDLDQHQILSGLQEVYQKCQGSFACVIMIPFVGLVAFRDANGIKPLVFGRRQGYLGDSDVIVASESALLQHLGFSIIRDVKPGEAVIVPFADRRASNSYMTFQVVPMLSYSPDIFEYVYFARPDSVIDGISVNKSRQLMGEALARTLKGTAGHWGPSEIDQIDCVIPVPETSYTAASAVAKYLGKPLVFGLVRNIYTFRTFILPQQQQRIKGVRRKLSAIQEEFEGRNVLIVDDSIVRGTTSSQIVAIAYHAGAKKVFLASCCPPIRYRHIHGIDLADNACLIAHGRTEEEIRQIIKCDGLCYLPLPALVEACQRAGNHTGFVSFEVGIFSGSYVTNHREKITATSITREALTLPALYHQQRENHPIDDTIQRAIFPV